MLVVGMAWSLGFATLAIGHLNILSVSFAAILVGLGVDFAIHYLARYLELRHRNLALGPALRETASSVGTGIVTAAVTTALAFFCATLTRFLGVAELGVIAGGGILLCCVSTIVVLPALVALADRGVEPARLPTQLQGLYLKRLIAQRPALVSGLSLAGIVLLGTAAVSFVDGRIASRVKYDSNLLNLQAPDVESVEVQKRVFDRSQGSLLYAVSIADSIEEARRRRSEFEELASVSRVEELATHMPQHSAAEVVPLVQSIHSRLRHISDFP